MELSCSVRGCSNVIGQDMDPKAKFFSFPSVKQDQGPKMEELSRRRRMAWVSAVKRPSISFDHISHHSYVCSRHFHKGQPSYEWLNGDPDWAPSLNLGHSKAAGTKRSLQKNLKRSKLQKDKAKKRTMPTALFLTQNECCVVGCGGRSHNDRGQRIRNGLTFYTFPVWRRNNGVFISDLSKRQRQAWVEAVGRDDITFDNVPHEARVCSRHFISGKPAYEMKEQDPDWAPSLQLKNEQNQGDRNPPTIRGKSMKNKPKPSETPSAHQWKKLESGLQRLMRDKQQPTETPPVLNDTVQDFKDFFQNALKASLDACLVSSSPLKSESGFPAWSCFPQRSVFSVGNVTPGKPSTVSMAPCENCVWLQDRILELEERLSAPVFLQNHIAYSQWTQPQSN